MPIGPGLYGIISIDVPGGFYCFSVPFFFFLFLSLSLPTTGHGMVADEWVGSGSSVTIFPCYLIGSVNFVACFIVDRILKSTN